MKKNKIFLKSILSAIVILSMIVPSFSLYADSEKTQSTFAQDILSDFQTPPNDTKSRPLWFWNEEVVNMSDEELEEIVEQSFYDSGYHGFGILPNWIDGYMGELYMHKYGVVIKKADELGMKICLYDENGFPSYTAGGLFAEKFPDLTAKRLDKHEKEITGPASVSIELPHADFMGAVAMNIQTKERIDISEFATIVDGDLTGVYGSSYFNSQAGYEVDKAFDGDYETRWNAASFSQGNQWLEISYEEPTTFDRVDVKEALGRISSCAIEYWDGNAWIEADRTTTIGDGVTKSFTFDAITSKKVRFYIHSISSTDSASVYEMEVYNQGTKLAIPEQSMPSNLTYEVPEGTWKVMAFMCVRDGIGGMDYLDKTAVSKFIDITHEVYYREFGEYFGNTIDMSFYDEPTFWNWGGGQNCGVEGARMWTPSYNDHFEEQKGYDPTLIYPALWYDIGDDTDSARNDLQDVKTELFSRDYIGQLNQWCNDHDIKLTGHMLLEEIPNPVGLHGDLMKVFKHQDVPGVDLIGHYGYTQEAYKIISSAAYNYDKGMIMTESYGAMGEGMGVDVLYKGAMDQFAKGINLMIPHAIWYNNDPAAIQHPPELSYRSEKFGPELWQFNEYIGRLQMMLQDGRHVADIGMLYPIDYLKSSFKFTDTSSADWGNPSDGNYMNVGEALSLRHRRDFTYIHPEVLDENCTIENGVMTLNNEINFEEYKVFVLPAMKVMSLSNAQKIQDFYNKGGKVISVGQLPYISTEYNKDNELIAIMRDVFNVDPKTGEPLEYISSDYTKHTSRNGGMAFHMSDVTFLGDALDESLSVYDVRFSDEIPPALGGGNFSYIHKVKDGTDIYFLANSSDNVINASVDIRGIITPSFWDPMTGELSVPSYEYLTEDGIDITRVKLDMDSQTSVFVIDAPALYIGNPSGVDAKVIIDGEEFDLPYSNLMTDSVSSIEIVSNDPDYVFSHFSGDVFSTNNPLTVPNAGLENIMANFKYVHGTDNGNDITLNINGDSDGAVLLNGEKIDLPIIFKSIEYKDLIIDVVPPAGKMFDSWTSETPLGESPVIIVANEDINATANFKLPNAVNVALSKTVTSNNSHNGAPTWQPSNLTDGARIGAGYSSGGFSGPDIDGSVWVEIDLGKNETIHQAVLYPRTDSTSYEIDAHYFPQDYVVSVRADESDEYIAVATEVNHLDTALPVEHDFEPIEARYVKVEVTKLAAKTDEKDPHRFQLAEIEVYNTDFPAVESIDVESIDGANSITTIGESLELSADVFPANAQNKNVEWFVQDLDGTLSNKAEIIMRNGKIVILGCDQGLVDIVVRSTDGSGVQGKLRINIGESEFGKPVFTVAGNPIQKLSQAAGNTLTASVEVNNFDNTTKKITLFCAIYDSAGRLVDTNNTINTINANKSQSISVDVSVPTVVDGFTYKLFLWDTDNFKPLTESVKL